MQKRRPPDRLTVAWPIFLIKVINSRTITSSRRRFDLSRTGPLLQLCFWMRFWLVASGFLALGGSAQATGCHGPDRPSLGLSFSWNRDEVIPVVTPTKLETLTPEFRNWPCPVEQPGTSSRLLSSLEFASRRAPSIHLNSRFAGRSRPASSRDRPGDPTRSNALLVLALD